MGMRVFSTKLVHSRQKSRTSSERLMYVQFTSCVYWVAENKSKSISIWIYLISPWGHLFSTYAKFSEKLTFLAPLTRTRVRIKG